jgi:hypothetical protein
MAQASVEPTQAQKDRREALLKEYSEINNTFRALTDIRFRLLNLLPIAAAAAAFKCALRAGRDAEPRHLQQT